MEQTRDRAAFLPTQKLYNPERGLSRQIVILIQLQRIFKHPECKDFYNGLVINLEQSERAVGKKEETK